MEEFAIITFHTTHFAIKAKSILEKDGRRPLMVPVPRQFSSDCGICCKVPWQEKIDVEDLLKTNHVEIAQIFKFTKAK